MPPSKGASAEPVDPAARPLPAESALTGEAGANGFSAADATGWRDIGRPARSSGSPNPTLDRWTGLTGVAPMLPTERATVGLEPSVGAFVFAEAALGAGGAEVAGAGLADR